MHSQDRDPAFSNFNAKMFPILVTYHIPRLPSPPTSNRFLVEFAQLVFEAFNMFQFHTVLGENPFLKQDVIFDFAKEYVYDAFVVTETIANDIEDKELENELAIIQQEHHFDKEKIPPYKEDAPAEEQEQRLEAIRNANDIIQARSKAAKAAIKGAAQKVDKQAKYLFFTLFKRFVDMHATCQSPLEQAFLVGLFASREVPDWDDLLNPAVLDAQHEVGNYRLDFALFDKDRKLAVELDGHTYHERTEEQAVYDRVRDRELQQQGWQV